MVVGAYLADGLLGFDSGAVYTYETQDGGETWSQNQKLEASDGHDDSHFGYTVCLNDIFLFVAAPQSNDNFNERFRSGSVYTFFTVDQGSTWSQSQKLTASDSLDYHLFGVSLALGPNRLAVGSFSDNDGMVESGITIIILVSQFHVNLCLKQKNRCRLRF